MLSTQVKLGSKVSVLSILSLLPEWMGVYCRFRECVNR